MGSATHRRQDNCFNQALGRKNFNDGADRAFLFDNVSYQT